MRDRVQVRLASFLIVALVLICSAGAAKAEGKSMILATTTSTYDTGLLDELLPLFEKRYGISVKVIAVGTGQALALGRSGNADALLVHAPAAEEAFMAQGHGSERLAVMHNDFLIVGPASDPAGIRGMKDAVRALAKIAESKALFISRGDDSGTHKRERALWKRAGTEPSGDWYIECGQGMAATLRIAYQKNGYTLTDRGTYLSQRKVVKLEPMVEGDPALVNPYHIIVVSKKRHPKVKAEHARLFARFLVDPETQRFIGSFGIKEYGEPLFHPDALKERSE
ncbi:MAG TPA: tungsten ABC transporter substrate-binding protein [Proteobacteria bacterium]|nr:tungsten ABC transporter substrate-binding protein [Pseudomonadota bacterium]